MLLLLPSSHPIRRPPTRSRLLLLMRIPPRRRRLPLHLLPLLPHLPLLLNPHLGPPFLPLNRFLPKLDTRRDPTQNVANIIGVDGE
jgi:hypothetical protein